MQAETIYKGATRPAMKMGVPLVPLVALAGGGMLLMLWSGILVSWWLAMIVAVLLVPAIFWMRLVTARDDQRFLQMFVALRLRLRHRNGRLWHSRSYTPNLYRGARDAWHS